MAVVNNAKTRITAEIVQEIWKSALNEAISITPDSYPGEKWDLLQATLVKLPAELVITDDQALRDQFVALNLTQKEIENLGIGLWRFFEEQDIGFDLTDDGMDEAENYLETVKYLVKAILDPSEEVLYPSFIAEHWVRYEYLDECTPHIWIDYKDQERLMNAILAYNHAEHNGREYNNATRLWLEKEMDCIFIDENQFKERTK